MSALVAFLIKSGKTPVGKAVEHALVAGAAVGLALLGDDVAAGHLALPGLQAAAVAAGATALAGLRAAVKALVAGKA